VWLAAREGAEAQSHASQLEPERRIEIRTRPHWIEKRDTRYLLLPCGNGKPLEVYAPAKSLPAKELKFTVWLANRVLWQKSDGTVETMLTAELDSISDGDKVYYDHADCPVHHRRMARTEVPIHYGLLAVDEKAARSYRGGPGWVAGGCVVMPDAPRTAWAYRCDRCAQAYARWLEKTEREWNRRQAAGQPATKR
jgi:hypothetical protein